MANATNATATTRVDPIRKRYYDPLERAEKVSGWLFYIAAITSFLPLMFSEKSYPIGNSVVTAAFVLLVIANFVLGIVIRLYFFPRAEDARRKEFLSNAFNFDLIHQRTIGYYNNDETSPLRRIGMLVMENLFFSKAILGKMAPAVRARAAIYFVLWFGFVIWRATPLDWLVAGAQVLFTEEILTRWIRLEWARNRAEKLYDIVHSLFQVSPTGDKLTAYSLQAFGDYEVGKALGGILLSQRIFDRDNPSLTQEWEKVKNGLPPPSP